MEQPENIKIEPDKQTLNTINKKIFRNLLIAIGMILYFYFLNLGFVNIENNIFTTDLKVFAISILAISIIVFEVAYKKDSGVLAIHGIEVLILSIITLYLIEVYFHMGVIYRLIPLIMPFAFGIYYVIKSIIIYIKGNKEYIKNLSDISEITQKDEEI